MASLELRKGILGERLAGHLLRRATYRYDIGRIKEFAQYTASEAVDKLMLPVTFTLDQPIDPATGAPWINNGTSTTTAQPALRNYVRSWVLNEMRFDETIHGKMVFFLHKCLVTTFIQSTSERFFDYLALLYKFTTGSFKVLARKMTMDNLMLIYLNNTNNNKNAPNENYAREFLELFTIGKGPQIGPGDYTNYTEEDVVVGAKLLTGIRANTRLATIDPDTGLSTGRFAFGQHNTEDKTFSAAFDNRTIKGAKSVDEMPKELEEYVDMVFSKIETARLYCRRLYRYFISSNITPEIESDIINPLAQQLMDNNYETASAIKTLLTSVHFYDEDDSDNKDEIIGALIKSPLELFLGSVNFLHQKWPDQTTETASLYNFINRLAIAVILDNGALPFFAPYDVAGYSAYYQEPVYDESWFTANTIVSRYKLCEMLLTGTSYLGGKSTKVTLDLPAFVRNSGFFSNPGDPIQLTKEMANGMLPEPPDDDRINYFLNEMLDGIPPADWTYEWVAYTSSGDPENVKIGLSKLLTAIMYSQEYQLL